MYMTTGSVPERKISTFVFINKIINVNINIKCKYTDQNIKNIKMFWNIHQLIVFTESNLI